MSAFAKALSPALREVRILMSQTGTASAGARCVLLYFDPNNPLTPHAGNSSSPLTRRSSNITPTYRYSFARPLVRLRAHLHDLVRGLCVHCRYSKLMLYTEKGVEKHVELEDLSAEDVSAKLTQLLH